MEGFTDARPPVVLVLLDLTAGSDTVTTQYFFSLGIMWAIVAPSLIGLGQI